jgi:predicted nuclease of predicted toxin-antitoxin system
VSERIRFHLDEHVDPDIAAALRRHGVDVTTTIETALRTAPDRTQVEFARSQQRVIVTDDAHMIAFGNSTQDHPGIVIVQRHRRSTREIISGLLLIYQVLTPKEMAGRIEWI